MGRQVVITFLPGQDIKTLRFLWLREKDLRTLVRVCFLFC